MHILNWFSMD